MAMQRILALVKVQLKKLYREPALLFMIILFPLLLTLSFGLAFGSLGEGEITYDLAVINKDKSSFKYDEKLIDNLEDTEVFNIIDYNDEEIAEADLKQGLIDAYIIIPKNFGDSLDSYLTNTTDYSSWINTTIDLTVDSSSQIALEVVPSVVQKALIETIYGKDATSAPKSSIEIGSTEKVESNNFTQYDFMAPGLFVMAAIFIIMTISQGFTEEREQGLLKRINTTPTSSTEFIISHVITNMILAILQVALILGVSFMVGYRPLADISGLAMAFIIMSIFALCSIGLGLITASLAKSSGAATGIAFIFIMPQMFFGTFIPLGSNEAIQTMALGLPSYYATDALTSLLLRGAPVSSPMIIYDLAVLSIISVVLLIIGILIFEKHGKK